MELRNLCEACCGVVIAMLVICSAAPVTKTTQNKVSIKPIASHQNIQVAAAEKELQDLQTPHQEATSGAVAAPSVEDIPQTPIQTVPATQNLHQTAPVDTAEGADVPNEPAERQPLDLPPQLTNADDNGVGGLPGFPAFNKQPGFADDRPQIDLTPRAVAEYLLITSNFDGFEQALTDLLRANVLTPAEIRRYKDAVIYEYDILRGQIVDTEAAYIEQMTRPLQEEEEYYNEPEGYYPANVGPDARDFPLIDVPFAQDDLLQVEQRRAKQASIDELLTAILTDYYAANGNEQQGLGNDYSPEGQGLADNGDLIPAEMVPELADQDNQEAQLEQLMSLIQGASSKQKEADVAAAKSNEEEPGEEEEEAEQELEGLPSALSATSEDAAEDAKDENQSHESTEDAASAVKESKQTVPQASS